MIKLLLCALMGAAFAQQTEASTASVNSLIVTVSMCVFVIAIAVFTMVALIRGAANGPPQKSDPPLSEQQGKL
jgi:heme/copper-type cytochrome/quinol oxidase subunit 2